MNPTLSSLRNDTLPHQRLSAFERPSKRPRQNPIVFSRGQTLSPLTDVPDKHRKLAESRSLLPPPRPSLSQNRVTISSLLSMRPPGSPPLVNKPQLPTLNEAFLRTAETKTKHRSETLSPMSLVSSPKLNAKPDGTLHTEELSTSLISMQHVTTKDIPTVRMVPKLPEPTTSAPSGAKRKVIPCPYEFCQKKFSRNSNLKVHMRIHTKTYPFACNLCEREFMWSSSLHWHTKWHEKVAMREAAKLRNSDGVGANSIAGNVQGCTCTCVCPVHKTKPISAGEDVLEGQKMQSTRPHLDASSPQ